MNCANLAIYEQKLNYVEIPDGTYTIIRGSDVFKANLNNFCVTDTLLSNRLVIDFFNNQKLENHQGGVYTYFNDVNSTSAFFYDVNEKRYCIKEGFEDCPFQGMTWRGASEVARFFGGRLMTELEWEICARAGHVDYIYPWGIDSPDIHKANYGNLLGRVSGVREYPPNEWGLYDMAGNLREWCQDIYHPSYPFANTYHPEIKSSYRVVRGGAWDKTENQLLCSFREGKWFRIGTMGIGFRICKAL